jgi:hypothetical protein
MAERRQGASLFVIAGQKAPTGPREARPDDRLRAVFAPLDPAIHAAVRRRQALRSVVVAALNDFQLTVFALAADSINQPVIACDAPGPKPLQGIFKGLRFPEPLERIALDIFDQVVDGGQYLLIGFAPMQIIFSGLWSPNDLHAAELLWLDQFELGQLTAVGLCN